jgi:hypothetical protein
MVRRLSLSTFILMLCVFYEAFPIRGNDKAAPVTQATPAPAPIPKRLFLHLRLHSVIAHEQVQGCVRETTRSILHVMIILEQIRVSSSAQKVQREY